LPRWSVVTPWPGRPVRSCRGSPSLVCVVCVVPASRGWYGVPVLFPVEPIAPEPCPAPPMRAFGESFGNACCRPGRHCVTLGWLCAAVAPRSGSLLMGSEGQCRSQTLCADPTQQALRRTGRDQGPGWHARGSFGRPRSCSLLQRFTKLGQIREVA
jgi:hypothetical protein